MFLGLSGLMPKVEAFYLSRTRDTAPDGGGLSISFYSGCVTTDLLVCFSVSLSSSATIKLDGLLLQSIFGLNLA